MYLLEISQHTGLIKDDKLGDSWKAIDAFKKIVEDKKLGINVLTAIALTVDYASIIRHYSINERHIKALRLVPGDTKGVIWHQDKIQEAMNVYNELQYNPALEEKKLLDELKIKKLNEIKSFKAKEGNEEDEAKKVSMFKQLNEINSLLKKWKEFNPEEKIYDASPVVNGYKLSRLEQLLLEKNSKSNIYNKH